MSLARWTTDAMFVSYRQYYLQGSDFLVKYGDTDTVERIFVGNSLAAGGPEHLTVYAGTDTGTIHLTTEKRQDAPPPPESQWETVVDVSIYSTSGELWLTEWGGDVLREAGNFATDGPGWYRIRIHARGRDEGESDTDTSEEKHFISVWPAPPEPDHVHKATDAFARNIYDPKRPPGQPIQPDDPSASLVDD